MTSFSTEAIRAKRIAFAVSYNGANYHGWQRQLNPPVKTVQAEVEKALSIVAGRNISVICAGRTDTGVHGTYQVIHIEDAPPRSEKAWVMGANSNLPRDISVHWALGMDDEFHARFSANSRTYRYFICDQKIRPAHAYRQVTYERKPLDAQAMNEAAQVLLGEQDFSSFRGAGCQSNSAFRNVTAVKVERRNDLVMLEISANAFLLHMVRNIVGSLLMVGRGERDGDWFAQVLALKDRSKAGMTAAPDGLYLIDVTYPNHPQLPPSDLGPWFMGNA